MRLKQARAERFKGYDNKRKNLLEELEERERAFKKVRVDKQKEEVARWHETEKIKDEGRRLREEKEKELQKRESERYKATEKSVDELEEPSLGACNRCVETLNKTSYIIYLLLMRCRSERHNRSREVHAV